MAIDRTWFNNLVDDDGSGQVGTVWNKAAINGLLNAIDGCGVVAGWSPIDGSGAGLSLSVGAAWAARLFNTLVVAAFNLSYPTTGDARQAAIGGLPYTVGGFNACGVMLSYCTLSPQPTLAPSHGSNIMAFYTAGGAGISNAGVSGRAFAGIAIYQQF